ncbi:hypothetical protein GIB67_042751, partial [Kingdonia uniflora]
MLAFTQKLDTQIGQIASQLSEREKGKFPSQPITNPGATFKVHTQQSLPENIETAQVVMTLRNKRTIEAKLDHIPSTKSNLVFKSQEKAHENLASRPHHAPTLLDLVDKPYVPRS